MASASYSKITQGLFTGPTGREMGKRPAETRELFVYLLCSPLRSNFGLYQVSVEDMALHTGRTIDQIEDALMDLAALEAVSYNRSSAWVFVHEMAHIQYDTPLKPQDFKCKTARKFYRGLPNGCPFMARWWDRYVADFNLDDEGGYKRFGPGEEQSVVPSDGSDFDIADDFALVPQEEAILSRGPESAVNEIIRRHSERYAREFPGRKYDVKHGKDGKILKDLIAVHGADVVDAMDQELFNRHRTGADTFIARSTCDIGSLQYHFNRLQQPPPRMMSAATEQNVGTVNRFVERARRESEPSD
jgi:hypothetical protein